ncbi:MAG: hypothetical protein ACXADW_22750 [Candidatus Hodarchaeales archaeon]|jgi:hypothetical protein
MGSKNFKIENEESNETSETSTSLRKKQMKKKKKIEEQDDDTSNKTNHSFNQLIYQKKVGKHLMKIDIGQYSR